MIQFFLKHKARLFMLAFTATLLLVVFHTLEYQRLNLVGQKKRVSIGNMSDMKLYCESKLLKTNYSIDVSLTPIDLDVSETLLDLTQRSNPDLDPKSKYYSENIVFGQTRHDIEFALNFNVNEISSKALGVSCLSPQISIDINQLRHTILVANEYLEDACTFRAIKEHELLHVAINNKYLLQATQRVKEQMDEYYSDFIFYGPTSTAHQDLYDETYEYWYHAFLDEYNQMSVEHEQLDRDHRGYLKSSQTCASDYRDVLIKHGYY